MTKRVIVQGFFLYFIACCIVFAVLVWCLKNCLSQSPELVLEKKAILLSCIPVHKIESLSTIEKFLQLVASDFEKKGDLYDKYISKTADDRLSILLNGIRFELSDVQKIFCKILDEIPPPILLSNVFSVYIDYEVKNTYGVKNKETTNQRNPQFFTLCNSIRSNVRICLALGCFEDAIAWINSYKILLNKVYVYDANSYMKYVGSISSLLLLLENVYCEMSNKQIPDKYKDELHEILDNISANLDIALHGYLCSEMAIVANTVTSVLSPDNREAFAEGKKTLIYLERMTRLKDFSNYQDYPKETCKHTELLKSQDDYEFVYDNYSAETFVLIRTYYVPSAIDIYQRNRNRLTKLLQNH